jgi:hypothetical protein
LSIELGRPSAIQSPSAIVSLPEDDRDVANLLGHQFSLDSNEITWLSFSTQKAKLLEAAREVNYSCYGEDGESHGLFEGYIFFKEEDTSIVHSANLVTKYIEPLHTLVRGLPQSLKLQSRNLGVALSVDGTLVEVDSEAPFWLQLQSISFEIQYHHLILTFARQYIRFNDPPSASPTPQADHLSISALTHAMTITDIIYTTLTTSRILNGWYDAFHIQWQASLTIMGFVLAYPKSARTAAARKSISLGIEIFNIFAISCHCPTAAKMAGTLENLHWKAGGLLMVSRNTNEPLSQPCQNRRILQEGSLFIHLTGRQNFWGISRRRNHLLILIMLERESDYIRGVEIEITNALGYHWSSARTKCTVPARIMCWDIN